MYSVAKGSVEIMASVPRLKKLGYAAAFLMEDIWPLTEVQSEKTINDQKNNTQHGGQTASIATIDSVIGGRL